MWCVTQLLNAHVSVAVAKRCHPRDPFGLHDGLPGHECGSGRGCCLERICFVSASMGGAWEAFIKDIEGLSMTLHCYDIQ